MAKTKTTNRNKIFNLLKPYVPPASGWDRIYEWLLGKARIVMLIVELIVVATFVTKVVIDTQAKGLEDEIKVKDFELQRLAVSVEPAIRKLQNKTEMYKILWDKSSSYASVLSEVHSYIPNPGAELLVAINRDELTISGVDNFSSLAEIERAMKASTTFSLVSLTQLNTESSASGTTGDYILTAIIAKPADREKLIPGIQ